MKLVSGLKIEAEQMGMVALMGLILMPGAWWIARAKSGQGAAVRALLVGGFLASAAVVEGTMDRTANVATGNG